MDGFFVVGVQRGSVPFDAALFQMKCHRRECREAAKFIGSCEEIDGRTTEKFMEAGFLE